ncbi:MAG: EAL domain-containing protein [Gammaproteobacteria bacterium]|nr:EAL domain-containing protein [Gammaproteobacteria bacterium]
MSDIEKKQLRKLYELSLLLSGEPDEIIRNIAAMIAEFFEVRIVVLTEIKGKEIHLLCANVDGELKTNLGHLPLELTPCALVKEGKQTQFFDQVSVLFPKVDFLKQQHVSFYYGVPAMDSLGNVISTTCLLDDNHHEIDDQKQELLRTFGQRIAMELERKSAIEKQNKAELQMRKMSGALEQTADMVLITDKEGIVEYINPAFEKISGFKKSDVIGKKSNKLKSGRHDNIFYKTLWDSILSGKTFSDVLINKRKDGTVFYEDETITPIKNNAGDITHFVATGRDISQRMEHEQRLQYIAHHDALTNLPNRVLFLDRVHQSLARAKRNDKSAAILFFDLDRFKNINDTLGHVTGDKLLVEISKRLNGVIREDDTIARLGGDEFAVLVDKVSTENDIVPLAQKILSCLEQTVTIDKHSLYITASIGISLFPDDGEDADTLLKNADIAMYRAKDMGKNNYQFYSRDMSARAFQRLTLENELRLALKNDEFVLHYQPQVNTRNHEIMGVEALIRWQHPTLGLVSPGDFIHMLEETGLIIKVGEWVLNTACQQLSDWQKSGISNLTISVNVSGQQIHNLNFFKLVTCLVERHHISPQHLTLEITESILMDNHKKTIKIIDELDAYGFKIAIDDFGTGYSSLSYLHRFRIDTLKIDRSFIRKVTDNPDNAVITSTIIAMAHSLKLDIIAEGVENQQQLDFLQQRDCQLVQGYFFSHPLCADEMSNMLHTGISIGKKVGSG